jgi:hypothetical protein
MTSREFYQALDRALEPECKRLGYSRKRGTVSLWTVDLPTGSFFYEVSKGPKSPFIPYLGGRFKVDCDLTSSADHKLRGLRTAISYMEYFSDADLSAMEQLQDRVLRKIIGQKPPGEFDRLMLEAHAPLLQMQIGSRFRRHQVFKLPYLDGEDVSAWGLFLASRLEQTLVGARERPVFFMRVEDGQPDGPANGSQPARRVAMRPSSVAGSRR